MEYSKIIAVTGLPGLYELLNSKQDGAIVRSLEDRVSKFLSSRIHHFSHLESIEVFTTRENTNLVEVFAAMDKNSEKLPDEKDSEAVKKYFAKVYPEMDFERVYSSDLKKMARWFSILKNSQVPFQLTTETADEIEETAAAEAAAPPEEVKKQEETVETTPEKPAPKAKKTAPKKEETPDPEPVLSKPKKAPAKKKIKE